MLAHEFRLQSLYDNPDVASVEFHVEAADYGNGVDVSVEAWVHCDDWKDHPHKEIGGDRVPYVQLRWFLMRMSEGDAAQLAHKLGPYTQA
ncbi:MAG: hypothetical protein H6948_02130 [Zoogloeaceae bacterium]|nr:hypothetical protein [Zoogloeaceae bacterium]